MKNRGFYKFGLFLCLALFIASFFLPETMGDTPALIMALSMLCFLVFLIALIVSGVKAKKQQKSAAPETPTPPVVSRPDPAPAAAVSNPKPAPKNETQVERVHVRGVDKYASNIKAVASENPDYNLSKRELQEDFLDERVWQYQFFVKTTLVPEPDNEFDPNAIMVQADGLCVGYVPKGSTAHVRKLMESGRIKFLDLKIGGGKFKEVTEVDEDEYEFDRGEVPYSAILEIHLID